MKNVLNRDRFNKLSVMSGENKMFEKETGLINYRHDRCMSGESKMFKIETGLTNYWHDSYMSGKSKI